MDQQQSSGGSSESRNEQRERAASERLESVVDSSTKILVQAKTVFPFTLFPTTIKVDREKVTVTNRIFFQVFEVISVQVNDIVAVIADAGPVFGSLRIFNRQHAPKEAVPVNYLWKEDALKIKRILQGHIIARERGVDLTALSTQEVAQRLLDLGAGTPAENI